MIFLSRLTIWVSAFHSASFSKKNPPRFFNQRTGKLLFDHCGIRVYHNIAGVFTVKALQIFTNYGREQVSIST